MKPAAAAAATVILFAGVTGADQLAVNPYQDKGTHHELQIKADFDQGERVEIAKDRAAMTIKGWNDEYAITVEPQIPTTPGVGERPFVAGANRPFLSKKMEYKVGDVTAFIEPRTDNEFDIDFTLDAKPNTNVFTYVIKGAEDFDFFYQPELTAEEIAEGASRPDNVVGSYAVYHKTKANHRVGSTNYATGKAFHIYRPKAIDANGAEVWAQLDYVDGVLSVTVPQEFLDSAAYPIVVDPTFGYTTAGASFVSLFSSTVHIRVGTPAESGNVTGVSSYGNGSFTTTAKLRHAVYTDALALMSSQSSELSKTGTTAEWITSTFSGPAVVASTNYYVAVYSKYGDSNQYQQGYDTGGVSGDSKNKGSLTYPTWPDPISTPTNTTNKYSIYATYTASGGGSSSPTPAVILNGQAIINGQVVIQ